MGLTEYIDKTLERALRGTEEDWKTIDEEDIKFILSHPDQQRIAEEAIYLYRRPESAAKDLAATIVLGIKLDKIKEPYLLNSLRQWNNLYCFFRDDINVRFRATIATIEHSWYEAPNGIYVPSLKETLDEIIDTKPQLSELAREYLLKIS